MKESAKGRFFEKTQTVYMNLGGITLLMLGLCSTFFATIEPSISALQPVLTPFPMIRAQLSSIIWYQLKQTQDCSMIYDQSKSDSESETLDPKYQTI